MKLCVLSSARDFQWSCAYTWAYGDSSPCTCLILLLYDLYLPVIDCVSLGEPPPPCGELGEILRGVVTELCGGGRLSTRKAHAPLWEVRRRPCTRGEWQCPGEH